MEFSSDTQQNYDWLQGDVLKIAPKLLGWELVTSFDSHPTGGRIVEVEAYAGASDPASHLAKNLARAQIMLARGGHIYTYRSYGIHICMNIVVGPVSTGSAVLIRALEPTIGLEYMGDRRHILDPLKLCSGPGRLAQALGITLWDNGTFLGQSIRLLPPTQPVEPSDILATARIGITKAKDYPWRFKVAGNLHVSR